MSIAENRKHRARLRKKRSRYNNCPGSEVAIGKITTTPKQCGCWMCSNASKVFGDSISDLRNYPLVEDEYGYSSNFN